MAGQGEWVGREFIERFELAEGDDLKSFVAVVGASAIDDSVLGIEDAGNLLGRDSAGGEFATGEFEEDAFFLVAVEFYFPDAIEGEESVADEVAVVFEFGRGEIVSTEGVDVGKFIAEVIVDGRGARAGRKLGDTNLVPHVGPDVFHLEVVFIDLDGDDGEAGLGGGGHFVDLGKLADGLLDGFGDLLFDLDGGATGILGDHDRVTDGDGGVFAVADAQVGDDAKKHDPEIQGHRGATVIERDGGWVQHRDKRLFFEEGDFHAWDEAIDSLGDHDLSGDESGENRDFPLA